MKNMKITTTITLMTTIMITLSFLQFKRMLNKELSHFSESKSGNQISEYICNTFLGENIYSEFVFVFIICIHIWICIHISRWVSISSICSCFCIRTAYHYPVLCVIHFWTLLIDVVKGDDAFCWSWKAVMRKFSRCRVISISEQVARRCNDEENRGKFCKDINYFIAVKEGGTFKLEILQERGAVTRWYNWQNCKKEDILRTAAKVVFLCTQVFSSLVEDQHFGGFSSKGFKRRLGYIFYRTQVRSPLHFHSVSH